MHCNDSIGTSVLKMIGCIIAITFIVSSGQSCSRSERNMVYIKEGYCYDSDTQIIYTESYFGKYGIRTAYTPYYNSNGKLCKYNIKTNEWIPIDK